ncbi:MAG: hypothetical protein ABW100_01540 [Candidatus Thiodiazotropha sp. 6PLUC3]
MIRINEALIRGAIWAFIGLLYGMLFVFFSAFAEYWQLPVNPYLFAGVLSGTSWIQLRVVDLAEFFTRFQFC